MIGRGLAIGCAALALLLLQPGTAEAHLVSTRFGDFYGGVVHPLTSLEQGVPWLGLGILAGMQGPRRARWLLATFPLGLVAGAALVFVVHESLTVVTMTSTATLAVVGLLMAASCSLHAPLLASLGGALGVVYGYDNGTAMTAETNPVLFIAGVATAGYVVMALVIAVTIVFLRASDAWRRITLRAFGSWIGAVGIMVMGLRLIGR